MRYLITNQKSLFSNDNYEVITPNQALNLLTDNLYGLDSETMGFDPYTKKLFTVQIGNFDTQFCIDCTTVDIRVFKDFFECPDRTFILHNAKFDLRFFLHHRIVIKNVYDTYLGERLLYLGYPPGIIGMGLKDIAERYLQVELDKSVRGALHYEGLSDRVIIYGCDDVKYLIPLREAQLEKLKENGLGVAIGIENQFVIPLAYTEYSGIKLDPVKWKEKMAKDLVRKKEAESELSDWVIAHGNQKYIKEDNDLFTGYTKRCKINWNSPKQFIPLLEELGFNLLVKDKETGLMKKSTDKDVIEKQKTKSTISEPYLKYAEASTKVSNFGQNYLDMINPATGRIHTQFNQLVDTSRISSGGKDKDTDADTLNLQNIPADEETRACFIADKGNLLIDVDYSAQEDLVFVEYSREPKMIEFYNDKTRKRDGHSFTAKLCFPKELDGVKEEDVKVVRKDLRARAKTAKFTIHYGGNGLTIAKNLNIPDAEGLVIEKAYLTAYPNIDKYFKWVKKQMWDKGYILISPYTGHKAYIYDWSTLKKIERRFQGDNFWNNYRRLKQSYDGNSIYEGKLGRKYLHDIVEAFANGEDDFSNDADALIHIVKHFFKRKSASERQALNYPIQGCSAQISKIAAINYFKYLMENDLLFKVWIPDLVHDEIMAEAPEEIAQEQSKVLVDCMEKAGKMFVKVVELKAVPTVNTYWEH